MPLRAKRPEAIQKRLKLFLFGPAGIGKSTAAIQFKSAYIIDAERGLENYDKLINESGSVVLQTSEMAEVISEVRALLVEPHEHRTLVIDPITTVYDALLDKCEKQVGSEFGRHINAAAKEMKRLSNLIMALDMNVVVTAHAKREYGSNMAVLGQTFDGWRKLDYIFDLVIELGKKNKKRFGKVVKSRVAQFPDEDVFDWSYAEFVKRYGAESLEKISQPQSMATAEQVKELNGLLEIIRLPEGTTDKWFAKANVEAFEDMSAEVIGKCITFCKDKLPKEAAKPKETV